jgi:hypothetical protein
MVEIRDGDAGARSKIIVCVEIEVAHGSGVVVALQMAAYLVVPISDPSGKKPARRVEQQTSRLNRTTGYHYDVCQLLLAVPVTVDIKNAPRTPMIVGKDFCDHALCA